MHARKYVHDESYGRSYLMLLFELTMCVGNCLHVYYMYDVYYLVPLVRVCM